MEHKEQIECPKCLTLTTRHTRGTYKKQDGTVVQRYTCQNCEKSFTLGTEPHVPVENLEEYIKDDEFVGNLKTRRRIIVTSAQNNTAIDKNFLACLKTYSRFQGAAILIIPIRYRTVVGFEEEAGIWYPEEIRQYLIDNRVVFEKHNLVIDGSIRIQATAENPLSGLDPLSKGKSLLIGHAQLQLRTMPRLKEKYPAILSTTGSISEKNYTTTKAGQKAEFNHSMSAAIIEFEDDGTFHIRHLNYDEKTKSFCDLDKEVFVDRVSTTTAEAIVTGDEHAMFIDETAKEAIYGKYGLVAKLSPKYIVRHDVLDAYSISHHHQKSVFTQYSKMRNGTGDIRQELNVTIAHIRETTPSTAKNVIVQSNHNEHLARWLNEADPKKDLVNAKFYYWLMYNVLNRIDAGDSSDPFEIVLKNSIPDICIFSKRKDGFMIKGIECGSHGDVGTNGAKGTRSSFAILPQKTIIGHSHSPGIEKGCYQVGTTSLFDLEYTKSASSWHHAECIIHSNGKRQLVFITNGKYRL